MNVGPYRVTVKRFGLIIMCIEVTAALLDITLLLVRRRRDRRG